MTTALPESFDWRTAKEISIEVLSAPGGFPGTANMSDVVNDSPQHPVDTYGFQGVGWLTETEAAARDGKAFLAPCTPDPGKK
ncbi:MULTISPECIES: hypothetical protein [unclassified Mycobacterium]|uniref:hypothetical protein n=1 Tax=unclassified Mycobacterium TaxID=2642494 RepID=UPI0029C64A7F|nr:MULTISPECIES: hypothetical protein [unclassified Mycobacterium]